MKPQYLTLIKALCLFFLMGCSAQMATSLLVDSSTCASTDITCSTPTSTTSGTLDIQATNTNNGVMSMNMDVSDTVEITGVCRDLNRKNNRILVQVFAGDVDETADPYIDNTTSDKCLNTASGIAITEKCFSVTKGIGLIESAGLPDQRDFPQCHDGQFGFSVRLGKILTDTTLGTNYLVRFKLRTQEGSLSDTPWSRVTITRKLSAPSIDTMTPVPTAYQCTLATTVARFNQNIQYSLQRTATNGDGTTVGPVAVPGFGATSASPLAYQYTDSSLVDGMTYSYSLTATEGQYAGLYGGVPQTATSNVMTCQFNPPTLQMYQSPTANTCYFSLAQINAAAGISYDIAYGSAGWVSAATTPTFVACTGSFPSAPYYCSVSGLVSNQNYSFAVRARGAGGEVGKWSNELQCKPQ